MQSHKVTTSSSHTQLTEEELIVLQAKADLFDELNIMLVEAGQRGTPEEAAVVISANLAFIAGTEKSPLIADASENWKQLTNLSTQQNGIQDIALKPKECA